MDGGKKDSFDSLNRQFNTILNRSRETLDMVISTPTVAQLDEELLGMWERNEPMPNNLRNILKEGLSSVQEQYDVVLIDCPPGLSFFSSTSLIASDFFISPVIPEPLSLEGVKLVWDRARELSRIPGCNVEFAGVILNIVKHYRYTHKMTAQQIYGDLGGELKPFVFWLPDNERLRGLGEFEIDTERIKEGWAAGVDTKFHLIHTKYSIGWLLNNPTDGSLTSVKEIEGDKYRLFERIERLVQEFAQRTSINL